MRLPWMTGRGGARRLPLFEVNLSTRYRVYVRPLGWTLTMASVLLVGMIVWEVRQAQELEARIDEIQPAVARLRNQDRTIESEGKKAGLDLSDGALTQLPTQVAFVHQLVAKRQFSWTVFLGDLEEAVPPRVSVHSIRLEGKGTVIRLAGSAGALQDVTKFTKLLGDHRSFADPVLVQHRAADSGHIEFDMTVTFVPKQG